MGGIIREETAPSDMLWIFTRPLVRCCHSLGNGFAGDNGDGSGQARGNDYGDGHPNGFGDGSGHGCPNSFGDNGFGYGRDNGNGGWV